MSDDLLARATASLREGTAAGDDAGAGDATWARVQGTIHRSRRRRRVALIAGLQVGLAGVGLGAWAAASGKLEATFDRLAERIGLRAPSAAPRGRARSSAAVGPGGPRMEPSMTPEPPPAPSEPAPAAAPAAPPATPRPHQRVARVAARELPPPGSDELYRQAHEAHFVRRDWAGALAAWDRYLAAPEVGRFALEARYNRGVALVRLGRRRDAVEALRPFAEGDYGSYRQSEARALLKWLGAPQPP